MKIRIAALAVLALFSACKRTDSPANPDPALNKFADSNQVRIYEAQDHRDTPALLPWLRHAHAAYREAAALAFASVQDSNAVDSLAPLLQDSVRAVQEAAAWALGQTRHSRGAAPLLRSLSTEKDEALRSTLWQALGKCAPDARTYRNATGTETPGWVEGAYRLAARGKADDSLARRVFPHLRTRVAALWAAHFFARARNLDLKPWADSLLTVLEDPALAPEAGMALAQALGRIESPAVQERLLARLEACDVQRDNVLVVALWRSLKSLPEGRGDAVLRTSVLQGAYWAGITAAEHAAARGSASHTALYLNLADSCADAQVRAVLLEAVLSHAPATDPARETAIGMLRGTTWEKTAYAACIATRSLAADPAQWQYLDSLAFHHVQLPMKTAAMEGLVRIARNPAAARMLPQLADVFRRGVLSGDVSLMAQSAEVLRDPALNFRKHLPDSAFLRDGQALLTLPRDMETWYELQSTLDFWAGREAGEKVKPAWAHPIDWKAVKTLPAVVKVQVQTSKGDFEMSLFTEKAPGSVENIVRLIRSGFYDGKYFHRIVPDFVAQGGCPRGDGWGSDSLLIRSEFAPGTYRKGTLGLASAGKDTESCQWFVSTVATPHLDGNYTIFGEVTGGGIAVPENLVPGDKIIRMTVQP